MNFYFGGTSLLIVVGVAMDTVNQVEAQLIMRHYEGFTPRAGRIRGRRQRTNLRTPPSGMSAVNEPALPDLCSVPQVRGRARKPSCCVTCLGLPHISTGDMLRERVASRDELGEAASSNHAIRRLWCRTRSVNAMVEERIEQPDCVNRVLSWTDIRGR